VAAQLVASRVVLSSTTLVSYLVVPSSPILVTLMKEALSSSETSVFTRTTRRNIPEDDILHSHRRENLKSYITVLFFHVPKYHKIILCKKPNKNCTRRMVSSGLLRRVATQKTPFFIVTAVKTSNLTKAAHSY
jgi:hypothetical protein